MLTYVSISKIIRVCVCVQVQIFSEKKDYAHVESRCGSTANIKHKPKGGEKKVSETHKTQTFVRSLVSHSVRKLMFTSNEANKWTYSYEVIHSLHVSASSRSCVFPDRESHVRVESRIKDWLAR